MLLMLAAPIATLAWLTATATPMPRMERQLEPRDGNPGLSHGMTNSSRTSEAKAVWLSTHNPAIQQTPQQTDWTQATLRYAVLAYLLGTAILTLRLLNGYWRLRRLRRNVTPTDATLQNRLTALMKRWGITRSVALVESAMVEVPTVVGFLRPMILLPLTATSGLSADQVSALIAHELAHVRRHDFLINAMQAVIETLLFYHPAIWWISRRIRQEREHCCDDMVVSLGTSRVVYAKALAEMESLRPSTALAMAANSGSLLPRIRRILQPNGGQAHRLNINAIGMAIFASVILMVTLLVVVACKQNVPTTSATTQPAADTDDQYTITLETRAMLVSSKFFDNVGLFHGSMTVGSISSGTDKSADASKSDKPSDVQPFSLSDMEPAILDNETLNLLTKAVQADERSLTFDHPRMTVAESQTVRITSKDAGVVLPEGTPPAFGYSFTVSHGIGSDDRYVTFYLLDLAVSTGTVKKPAGYGIRVPHSGTLLMKMVPVEGDRYALFLARPYIHKPKNVVLYEWNLAQKRQIEIRKSQEEAAKDLKARRRLEETVNVVSFDQTPLHEVLTYFRNETPAGIFAQWVSGPSEFMADAHTPVDIFVHWAELNKIGIDKNTPVKVDLRRVSFGSALRSVLRAVDDEARRLDYTIDDGVITITTKEDLQSERYRIVKVYDIRDMVVPDVHVTTPFPPIGAAREEPTPLMVARAASDIAKEIINVIETTVATDSWVSRGGKVGYLTELNGQLIINQTVDNHIMIYNLLRQLRETRALQIAIEARTLLVDNATFQKLNLSKTKNGDAVSNTLDTEQLHAFLKVIEESKTTETLDTPRVTLFNGQRGYIAKAETMNYIMDCSTKVGEKKEEVATNLTVDTLTCGLAVDLQGTVSADRKGVILKVRPRLRQLVRMETSPIPGLPAEHGDDKFLIQKPVVREAEITTFCNVPDDHTLVLGGMMVKGNLLPRVKRGDGVKTFDEIEPLDEKSPERQLIVLVKPKVILQKEIEMKLQE